MGRLARFIHYYTDEDENESKTISGSTISFISKKAKNIKSLIANIYPIQSGTGDPSPTNIRPITGWDSCNITRCGKNIFDEQSAGWVENYYINSSGEAIQNNNYKYSEGYSPVKPNTKYVISLIKNATQQIAVTIAYYNKDKEFISRQTAISSTSSTGRLTGAFETPAECLYIRISCPKNNTTNVQIELGETASTYETYNGDVYEIAFPNGDICNGTVDITSGILTVNTVMYVLDGTEDWSTAGSVNDGTRYFRSAKESTGYFSGKNNICSHYPAKTIATSTTHIGFGVINSSSVGAAVAFRPDLSLISTIPGWQEFLAAQYENNTPVVCVCGISSPVEYQLTQEQIETLVGYNNIWADTGDITVKL